MNDFHLCTVHMKLLDLPECGTMPLKNDVYKLEYNLGKIEQSNQEVLKVKHNVAYLHTC